MSIRQRRLDRGWSQEELALHSGLSARTIQRIESGRPAGLESLKCLAAVFETTISTLTQEQIMTRTRGQPAEAAKLLDLERKAIDQVQAIIAGERKAPLSKIEREAIAKAKALLRRLFGKQ